MDHRQQRRFVDFLRLPAKVTQFEEEHVDGLNRLAVILFALHIPVFMGVAYIHETGVMTALSLTTLAWIGPLVAWKALPARQAAMVMGFSAMVMGGLLVHFGQGPVQIEMHFYFFVLLALLSTYGNPAVVLTAAVTATIHHLTLWWLLPSSIFNYDASFWVVGVHAIFVVLESVASCYLARNFFDDVIGLEAIVNERTEELDARNADLRLVLDSVGQGLMTVELDGAMGGARSAAVETLLGAPVDQGNFLDLLDAVDGDFGVQMRMHWEGLTDGFMPHELILDQMPRRLRCGERHLRFDYSPITDAEGELVRLLVVISDVTAMVAREESERRQREVMRVFERVMEDKAGFLEFYEEADNTLGRIEDTATHGIARKREIHTLKGISAIFGLESIAKVCHEVETEVEEEGRLPTADDAAAIRAGWDDLRADLDQLIGERQQDAIEIPDVEYEALLHAVLDGERGEALAARIRSWRFDPLARRLTRLAGQVDRIGERLGKPVEVTVEDNGLRLDGARWSNFWSSFVHVLRNAVDHGIEAPEDREAAGKSATGHITLRGVLDGEVFHLEVEDDGGGVNWDRVASKAAEKGLPSATREDLVAALFAPGMSTRDQATDMSGRGVGMSALMESAVQRGGTVAVVDAPAGGTIVRFSFPSIEMTGEPVRAVA